MIDRLRIWALRRLGRDVAPAGPGRSLPPGVDEVRLLETPEALRLAEIAGVLASLDQVVQAMERLTAAREPGRTSADPLTELALFRFAVVQFVSCFRSRRGDGRLTPKQAFGDDGERFFDHVATLADQLTGPHARMVGSAETVVLLKRRDDQAGVVGVTTRARRPDRLTGVELASLASFMRRGRDAYAGLFDETRARVVEQTDAMTSDQLLNRPLLGT